MTGSTRGRSGRPLGASVAVVALFLVHVWFELDGGEAISPVRALIGASVHSAPEGLALGVACAVDPRFGAVVAFTLALHNVGEGIALSSYLVQREKRVRGGRGRGALQPAAGGAGHRGLRACGGTSRAAPGAARGGGRLAHLPLARRPASRRVTTWPGVTAISVVVIAATSMVAFAGAL